MTREAVFLPGKTDDEEIIVDTNQRPYTDAEAALEDWMEASRQAGTEARVMVKKLNDSTNPNSTVQHCDVFPVDKYDYHSLQGVIKKRWGGGDYRLMCFAAVNGGKSRLIQNKLISIAEEKEAPKNEQSEIIMLLREVLNRQAPVAPPSTTSMLSQVSELVAVMNALRPPERDSMADFMKTITLAKELGFFPGGNPETEINPMWESLASALPTLVSAAMRPQHQRANNPINNHPKNKGRAVPKEKPSTISIYIKQLEDYHKRNTPAEKMADLIAVYAPNFDELMLIVADEKFVEQNCAGYFSDPKQPFAKDWLIDVREWLLAYDGKPSKYGKEFDIPENDEDASVTPYQNAEEENADE